MKALTIALFFVLCFALLPASANISGTVSSSVTLGRTFPASDGVYIVTGDVTAQGSSPVLNVEAGVVVKFNAGRQLIIGSPSSSSLNGNLVINGTQA
ncbi:MAG: hypothetical protein K0B87_06130 [Candidatus Syntrophosphaera sp.]|nr:hypothetical protein [Candidatus Syntrophosphaera sp.]